MNILHENSIARAAELLQDNIKGKFTGTDELVLIRKDGRLVPVEINTSIVQQGGQKVVLSFVRDITGRKLAEKKIRESEILYRSLIETSPDAIVLMDINGTIIMLNKQALEVFGFELTDDLRGKEHHGHGAPRTLYQGSLHRQRRICVPYRFDRREPFQSQFGRT